MLCSTNECSPTGLVAAVHGALLGEGDDLGACSTGDIHTGGHSLRDKTCIIRATMTPRVMALKIINYMYPQLQPCNKPAAVSLYTSLPIVTPLRQAGTRSIIKDTAGLQVWLPVPCSAAQMSVLPAAAAAGPAPAAVVVAAPRATRGLLIAALRLRAANRPTLRNVTCTRQQPHASAWCHASAFQIVREPDETVTVITNSA